VHLERTGNRWKRFQMAAPGCARIPSPSEASSSRFIRRAAVLDVSPFYQACPNPA
jgi:hypothetical protein